MLSLLTGARRSNVLAMHWRKSTWSAEPGPSPAPRQRLGTTSPLTSAAIEVLQARAEANGAQG